ncbi:MAG: chemotaxis protein CheW [Spirochaetae bacterium HGW-Spirochaetae-1]|jgi:purine-binding chemotaxis protein CheW|nr:MAG: chemotaxis protein CheW [Spirochaetae bacterium HGW-Spirochaetae-1]
MIDSKGDVVTSQQVVCFKIGNEEYGVDILLVQEILKLPTITKLPKSVPYIMGVIDLRGKVIPIVDLSKKFKIDQKREKQSNRAIVVDISGKQVGLAIDSVSHVIKINSNDIEPPPPVVKGISGRYIVGIAKLETGFVVILDINQIFTSEEVTSL